MLIQRQLQDKLAGQILAGDIVDGSTVKVSSGEEGLVIGGKAKKKVA